LQQVQALQQAQAQAQAQQVQTQQRQAYAQQVAYVQQQARVLSPETAAARYLSASQAGHGLYSARQQAASATAQPALAVPVTTPRSSIFVSTKASPTPSPAPARALVRIPSEQKTLSQADLQQLVDAGFDISPVAPDSGNPAGSAYFRLSQSPIVVGEPRVQSGSPVPQQRLVYQEIDSASLNSYLEAQAQAQAQAQRSSQGVRLGSSGN